MIEIPGLARSGQSLTAFGLPLRTTKTMVDVYGELLLGRRDCQFAGSRLDSRAMASMSPASASVTISASSPSITERACLPDPPCEERIVTFWWLLACQSFANASLNAR